MNNTASEPDDLVRGGHDLHGLVHGTDLTDLQFFLEMEVIQAAGEMLVKSKILCKSHAFEE